MLKEIVLENFRVFGPPVVIRMRPVTILIGENSSGKSSIIKFLLMLQQSLDASATHFLESDGARTALGAFRDLRNSTLASGKLRFHLRFDTTDLPTPMERAMIRGLSSGRSRVSQLLGERVFNLTFSVAKEERTVREDVASVDVDAEVGYQRRRQTGTHGVVVRAGDEVLYRTKSPNLGTTRFLRFEAPRQQEPFAILTRSVGDRYLAPIRYEIGAIRHLSPVREESERAIVTGSPPPDDVGQRGEHALPHLQGIMGNGDGPRAELIARHLAEIAGVRNLRFRSSMRDYLVQCTATHAATGASVYLSDFGFGVSQCLPVLVQGALMPKNHLLMVEQPEAQLHPTAQLAMGSFFADLWTERQVPSLIETHSSNILLRLRRLIAQKKSRLRPEDVSVAYVHVDPKSKATVVENIDIEADGSIRAGLPMDFFGAHILEAMEMGAKA